MSETEYRATKQPTAVAYVNQPRPYLKDSEQRTLYKEVERGNKKIHAKIQSIKKEEPSDVYRLETDVAMQIPYQGNL